MKRVAGALLAAVGLLGILTGPAQAGGVKHLTPEQVSSELLQLGRGGHVSPGDLGDAELHHGTAPHGAPWLTPPGSGPGTPAGAHPGVAPGAGHMALIRYPTSSGWGYWEYAYASVYPMPGSYFKWSGADYAPYFWQVQYNYKIRKVEEFASWNGGPYGGVYMIQDSPPRYYLPSYSSWGPYYTWCVRTGTTLTMMTVFYLANNDGTVTDVEDYSIQGARV